jgi:hypothetical protein
MHSSGFAGAGHGISRFRPNGIPSSPHGMRVTLLRTSVKKSKFKGNCWSRREGSNLRPVDYGPTGLVFQITDNNYIR